MCHLASCSELARGCCKAQLGTWQGNDTFPVWIFAVVARAVALIAWLLSALQIVYPCVGLQESCEGSCNRCSGCFLACSACALLARQGRQSTWIDLSSWAVSFFRLVVPIAAVPSDAAAHCLAILRAIAWLSGASDHNTARASSVDIHSP